MRMLLMFIFAVTAGPLFAQPAAGTVPLSSKNFTEFNRKVSYEEGGAHLDGAADYGLLWLNGSQFGNGTIEFEVKGTAVQGQSFVGMAFHGQDNTTFDAVYFRPFNFLNPERKGHSVQYISLPGNDWQKLRGEFPGRYEDPVEPVPDPVNGWFHVRITVSYPNIKVYVNHASRPTMEVQQLSSRKQGRIGFWVGNGSEGWFRNLTVIPAD